MKAVTDAFFAWASNTPALPKSALGRALHYALEQRTLLETFYLDGRLEISNNMAERSIKPFVIGRKTGSFPAPPKERKPAQSSTQ
ncbi:transposase [uncultured Cloacibacillus sp.]|uniref:IS66 family transposase n=1 Tax=uncultured Cloacibacillus sp. TaxID=889794 RepID=UPI00338D7A95